MTRRIATVRKTFLASFSRRADERGRERENEEETSRARQTNCDTGTITCGLLSCVCSRNDRRGFLRDIIKIFFCERETIQSISMLIEFLSKSIIDKDVDDDYFLL